MFGIIICAETHLRKQVCYDVLVSSKIANQMTDVRSVATEYSATLRGVRAAPSAESVSLRHSRQSRHRRPIVAPKMQAFSGTPSYVIPSPNKSRYIDTLFKAR